MLFSPQLLTLYRILKRDVESIISSGKCPFKVATADDAETVSVSSENPVLVKAIWTIPFLCTALYDGDEDSKVTDETSNTQKPSLQDCLRLHLKEEKLDDFYCSHCKEFTSATQTLGLIKMPEYLTVHLKRFYMTKFGRWMKSTSPIQIPFELDVSEFYGSPCKYELVATANHVGSMNYGHCE